MNIIDEIKKFPNTTLYKDLALIKNNDLFKNLIITNTNNINILIQEYSQKEYPTISCGILTYNETHNIKRCLESLVNFDEIIILDSFSTDTTIEIIKNHFKDCKIIRQKWINDFSYHRNLIINEAKSDWIFYIDSDNWIEEEYGFKLKRIAKLLDFFKVDCVVSPIILEHNGHEYTDNRKMFRVNSGIKFFGYVHEEPMKLNQTLPNNIIIDLIVKHDGYDSDKVNMKLKNKRNLILTEKMVLKEPKNPKWKYFLSRELFFEHKYNEAQKSLDLALSLYKNNSKYHRYFIETLILAIKIQLQKGNIKKTQQLIETTDKYFPDCIDSTYYKSILLMMNLKMRASEINNSINIELSKKHFSVIDTTDSHLKAIQYEIYDFLGDIKNSLDSYNLITNRDIQKKVTSDKIDKKHFIKRNYGHE